MGRAARFRGRALVPARSTAAGGLRGALGAYGAAGPIVAKPGGAATGAVSGTRGGARGLGRLAFGGVGFSGGRGARLGPVLEGEGGGEDSDGEPFDGRDMSDDMADDDAGAY